MSRKVVLSILFTDLVGSTELTQRVGEDAAQELWRTHVALLREAIAAHHGEEVKNLGDGVMAVFASPSEAVACAVAMQQSVDRQNRRGGEHMGLRVGLQIGELTPEEGDYYGTAVAVAERLCKRAAGGQVLTTETLRAVTGAGGPGAYRGVGALLLKGITEAVPTLEVTWEPLPDEALPLPHTLGPAATSHFVGREDELRTLREAYARAQAGRREIVFLVGEPGMGKSRLAAEIAREAHAGGATVLYGRCDELVTPYQPFVEALGHLIRVSSLGDLREYAGATASELALLIPELGRRLPHIAPPEAGGDPESGRQRLFNSVASVIERSARDRMTVLILDDLHWADGGTVQLLRHLLRAEPFAVLVLATYRQTDLDPMHPLSGLLTDLHREHPSRRVNLRGFDSSEIAAAIAQRAGHDIGSAGRSLAETLQRATDGNPFFVEQVIGHLIETGRIVRSDGRWRFDVPAQELGIPQGVKELIERRLSRVSEACTTLLIAASVAGEEFLLEVLEPVTGVAGDELLDAIDEATGARFIVEPSDGSGHYRFTHTLVREAIYDGLGETRRARLHAKIAEVLEDHGVDAGPAHAQIARHLLASRPTGRARAAIGRKAADYGRRAAVYADQVFNHDEAAAAYGTALEALEMAGSVDGTERCELLLGLGMAHTRAHRIDDALIVLEQAVEISRGVSDPLLFARVAVAFGTAIRTSSKRESGLEIPVLESALERLGSADTPERADVLAVFAERMGPFGADPQRAAALAREGLAVATRLGDTRRIMWAGDVLVMNLGALSGEEQRSIAEENVARAEQLGDIPWRIRTMTRLIAAELAVGDVERVDEQLPELRTLAERTRDPHQIVGSRLWPIVRLVMEGRWEQAEEQGQEVVLLSDQHQLPLVGWPALLFIMRRAQGRLSEIEPLVRAAMRRSPMAWWKAALAVTYCEQDRLDEASDLWNELFTQNLDEMARDWMWSMLLGLLGECAHVLEDADRANVVYDLLLPYRHENIQAGGFYSGSAAVILGMCSQTCERFDLADQHFVDAAEIDRRSRAWPWLAITQLEHATMLEARRAPGDIDRAADLLSASIPRLEEFGMARHLARASSGLQQLEA